MNPTATPRAAVSPPSQASSPSPSPSPSPESHVPPSATVRRPVEPPAVPLASGFVGIDPYRPSSRVDDASLRLDRNEGPMPASVQLSALAIDPEAARRYPDARGLADRLAVRLGLDPARTLITAGGDDAIDRICRLFLEPGRSAVIHTPGFEMIERSIRVTGATVRAVPWSSGGFPVPAMLEASDASTRLFCVVSPNNPTGLTAQTEDVRRLARARPQAMVLVDLAYTEFAGEKRIDWRSLLDEPNVLFVRTFSKAWGLAALRLGWVVGPASIMRGVDAAGGPFAVSGPSLAVLDQLLAAGARPDATRIRRIAGERQALALRLRELGADDVPESSANFVYARWNRVTAAEDMARDLEGQGVRIRRLGAGAVRITCPGDADEWARLERALDALAGTEGDRALALPRQMPADVPSMAATHMLEVAETWSDDTLEGPDFEDAPAIPARRTGSRIGTVERRTNETTVAVRLDVDGRGRAEVNTGLGLIDHFLDALATHARFDLNLAVRGDLEVDDHHTIEDAAIVLGQALDAALGDRRGIVRFADASVPLDESLARAVVDCSGRPGAWVDLGLVRPAIGPVATENIEHFLVSFATSARCTVHIDVLRGRNDHHRAEAAFKAFAVALRRAVAIDPIPRMPSTKGSLT